VKVVLDTNVLVSALVLPGRVIVDDTDDDRVLEAAQAAGAGFIVSGDGHLLSLGRWGEIATLSPAEFVADPEFGRS
jgi:predicted nucleic acid-binding protein